MTWNKFCGPPHDGNPDWQAHPSEYEDVEHEDAVVCEECGGEGHLERDHGDETIREKCRWCLGAGCVARGDAAEWGWA